MSTPLAHPAAFIIINDGLLRLPVERVIAQLSMFEAEAVRAAYEALTRNQSEA